MTQISAVTFDLWQTLILDTRENGIARSNLRLSGTSETLRSANLDYDLTAIQQAYEKCSDYCRQIRNNHKDINFDKQVEVFIRFIDPALQEKLSRQAIKQIGKTYCDAFFSYPPFPHPNAVEVLLSIKNMGLKLGMISNTSMTPGYAFRQFLDEHSILEYFDILTFSDEVLVSKPSNKIFQRTLDELNVSPAQTVHVGDHPITDVTGANLAGLGSIWIEGFYKIDELGVPNIKADINVQDLKEVPNAITELLTSGSRSL